MLLRPSACYRTKDDTNLLIDSFSRSGRVAYASVIHVGAGCGTLALAAAEAGTLRISRVGISLRSELATRATPLSTEPR